MSTNNIDQSLLKYQLFDYNYTFKIGNIYDLYNTLLVINSINDNKVKTCDISINKVKTCDIGINTNYTEIFNNTNNKFKINNYKNKIYNPNDGATVYIYNNIHNVYIHDGIKTYNYASDSSSWNVYVDGNINYYKILKKNFSIFSN